MADEPLHVYLNDHLAGASAGTTLVKQAAEQNEGTEIGGFFAALSDEIGSDLNTLTVLIDRLGVDVSEGKGKIAELGTKITETKFSGETVGSADFGAFITLETISIGVEGKLCMWTALKAIENEVPELADTQIDTLIERARSQRDRIESKRLEWAPRALSGSPVGA
ncbi:MAG TPA: hypothetical protein VF526_15520 [Solirubrobacteraceae bacterium]|jgi:hypothetical protein